jgi:hypothetical protein
VQYILIKTELQLVRSAQVIIGKYVYTGYTLKNVAVSKVNTKCISHPTWEKHTLSAEETAQLSLVLPSVLFSCLLRAAGPVSKMASQQDKAFFMLRCVQGLKKTHHTRVM